MRTIFILCLTLSFLNSDDKLASNISDTLKKIIQESTKEIDNIKISYDPFNSNQPKVTEKQTKKPTTSQEIKQIKNPSILSLSMIFNKNAFINGKWYKENEKLADYKITKINQDIVVLKKKNKYTTLRLPSSDTILITKKEI